MNNYNYNVGYAFGCLKLFLAMLIALPSAVQSQCAGTDATKCGCPIAPMIVPNSTMSSWWSPSQNDTTVDEGQNLDEIIASDAGAGRSLLWPGGIVFYVIDPAFTSSYQNMIRSSIAEAQANVGLMHVEFVEARSSSGAICRTHYISIQPIATPECKAHTGMQLSGQSLLYLNEKYCQYSYLVIHELLHSLGRNHEHSRTDRETYLQVNYANIYTPVCRAFQKPGIYDVTLSLPYDHDSIMHYASCAGSCNNGYVFVKKDGSPIGANAKLSDLDVRKIRHMYPSAQKVKYIASRLCRDPNEPIESVESLGKEESENKNKKKKRRGNSTRDEDEDDYRSTGHTTSICGPVMLVLLAHLVFVVK